MDVFSVSVGRLAMTLHLPLREQWLALPDTSCWRSWPRCGCGNHPGVYRLDHDASGHDDRAVAIGLAALALTERAEGRAPSRFPMAGSRNDHVIDRPAAAVRAAAASCRRMACRRSVAGARLDPERRRL